MSKHLHYPLTRPREFQTALMLVALWHELSTPSSARLRLVLQRRSHTSLAICPQRRRQIQARSATSIVPSVSTPPLSIRMRVSAFSQKLSGNLRNKFAAIVRAGALHGRQQQGSLRGCRGHLSLVANVATAGSGRRTPPLGPLRRAHRAAPLRVASVSPRRARRATLTHRWKRDPSREALEAAPTAAPPPPGCLRRPALSGGGCRHGF